VVALLLAQSLSALDLWNLDGGFERIDTGAAAATVVIFVSTVCPVSNDYADRYVAMFESFWTQARFVFVYSNRTESVDDIRRHVAEGRYPFPVYQDRANALADSLGAKLTPTAFVIDRAGRVRYQGRIDDSANPARVTDRSLHNALRAVLAGRKVATPVTKPFG
jgi:hypothetical protein